MIFRKPNNKWIVLTLLILGLIPIVITAYEVIFSNDKSVIFLERFNPKISFLISAYYILLFSLGIYWFVKQVMAISRLKNEKAKAELMLLKSQVNPHFFFNMLNNLYGWVTKDQKRAQEIILKLSDMMRYSIYDGEKETVTLKDEISYLKNYIELHKMRYHKTIDINFTSNIDEKQKVPPLLFIILLENAFKHGVESLTEKAFVNISIATLNEETQFAIENNFSGNDESEKKEAGIGLKNLERRLELIYPDKHKLLITKMENLYKAQLILKKL